jgi:hypothetical protein
VNQTHPKGIDDTPKQLKKTGKTWEEPNDRLSESGKVVLRDYEGRVASSVSLSASGRLGEAALEEIETKKCEELLELVATRKRLNVACHVYCR